MSISRSAITLAIVCSMSAAAWAQCPTEVFGEGFGGSIAGAGIVGIPTGAGVTHMGGSWNAGDGLMQPRAEDGSVIAECPLNRTGYAPLPARAVAAIQDPYHPWPVYAYSRAGIDATRTHTWNLNVASGTPWHGEYYHRQWGQPLALVVPPTAAYHSVYSWGVAQTQSVPIHHQFRRPYPGPGIVGGGMFRPTPYWPSSTQQFGVYPVRGPW